MKFSDKLYVRFPFIFAGITAITTIYFYLAQDLYMTYQLISVTLGALALGIALDSQYRAKKTDEKIGEIMKLFKATPKEPRSTVNEALITVQAVANCLALFKKGDDKE